MTRPGKLAEKDVLARADWTVDATPERKQAATAKLYDVARRAHDIAVAHGLGFVMPAPQVDSDQDDIELVWLDVKRKRTLSLWFDDSSLTLSWNDRGASGDVELPGDDVIAERMRWVVGA